MPQSSNPTPRRSSRASAENATAPTAKKPRSASSPSATTRASRTVDLSAGAPKSSGAPSSKKPSRARSKSSRGGASKQWQQRKAQAQKRNLIALCFLVAASGLILGATEKIRGEYHDARHRVSQKTATLSDLTAQFESGKRRIEALSSASGKERVLVENGYIKPGERLLLFPKDKNKNDDAN